MQHVIQEGIEIDRMEGAEAQEFMNGLLMDVAGVDDMEDAHRVLVGRPRKPDNERADAEMHFKVTRAWRTVIQQDAAAQNMTVSEYLRDATMRRHRELAAAGSIN